MFFNSLIQIVNVNTCPNKTRSFCSSRNGTCLNVTTLLSQTGFSANELQPITCTSLLKSSSRFQMLRISPFEEHIFQLQTKVIIIFLSLTVIFFLLSFVRTNLTVFQILFLFIHDFHNYSACLDGLIGQDLKVIV